MTLPRNLQALRTKLRLGKCPKCKARVRWVMELASEGRKPAWRPLRPAASVIETYESPNGLRVDVFPADAWHRCKTATAEQLTGDRF